MSDLVWVSISSQIGQSTVKGRFLCEASVVDGLLAADLSHRGVTVLGV